MSKNKCRNSQELFIIPKCGRGLSFSNYILNVIFNNIEKLIKEKEIHNVQR